MHVCMHKYMVAVAVAVAVAAAVFIDNQQITEIAHTDVTKLLLLRFA